MSNSPFLLQRQRKLAATRAADQAQTGPTIRDEASEAGREYAVLKVQLDEYLRQLADTESVEARKPMKVEFAKTFANWVDGVVEADQPVQDEIVMTCMIWAIDTGDFSEAVRLGEFALKHGLTLPERYNRSTACFLREDIAETELAAPGSVPLELLEKVDELTAEADMPDAAKAKLDKVLGRAWRAKADAVAADGESAPAGAAAAYVSRALDKFKRAFSLDNKAGVKKDIEQMTRRERELKSAAETGSDESG